MRSSNGAGNEAREIWQSGDDPCGYVTDTPNTDHEEINQLVALVLQRVTEIDEAEVDTRVKSRAWRVYNLARELAATAGKATEPELTTLNANMHKVAASLEFQV